LYRVGPGSRIILVARAWWPTRICLALYSTRRFTRLASWPQCHGSIQMQIQMPADITAHLTPQADTRPAPAPRRHALASSQLQTRLYSFNSVTTPSFRLHPRPSALGPRHAHFGWLVSISGPSKGLEERGVAHVLPSCDWKGCTKVPRSQKPFSRTRTLHLCFGIRQDGLLLDRPRGQDDQTTRRQDDKTTRQARELKTATDALDSHNHRARQWAQPSHYSSIPQYRRAYSSLDHSLALPRITNTWIMDHPLRPQDILDISIEETIQEARSWRLGPGGCRRARMRP
jgi:hypothetical protein